MDSKLKAGNKVSCTFYICMFTFLAHSTNIGIYLSLLSLYGYTKGVTSYITDDNTFYFDMFVHDNKYMLSRIS